MKNKLTSKATVAPVAVVSSLALLLSACGPAANVVSTPLLPKSSDLPSTVGTATNLSGLPSTAPDDGFAGGGGGLTGDVWPVWGLPGLRSATDPGIPATTSPVLSVIGLRPKFTALPGQGSYEFKVQDFGGTTTIWDSQDAGNNSDCTVNDSEASCTLPTNLVGSLKNGSTYRLVTTAGGGQSQRLFSVQVMPGASGNQTAAASGRQYLGSGSSVQVSIDFNSADQGPTPGTAVTEGPRWGLPAGWKWSGPTGGLMSINRSDNAGEYSGYSQLLTVKGSGAHQTLGCQPTTAPAAVCGQLAAEVIGGGMGAVIGADNSVVVTDQSSGQNWTFDANNQLVAQAAPGMAPMQYTYRTLPGATSQVLSTMTIPATGWTWTFLYSGDTGCQDSKIPSGLIAAPSGYTCGWKEPAGDQVAVFYSQPEGASVPRISRTIQIPVSCPDWTSCDASSLGIFDLGWNSNNQIEYQRSDSMVNAAILGNISDADKEYWSKITYDDLGRIATATQAKIIDGVDPATTTYSYTEARPEFAPATREISSSVTVGGSDPLTMTAAVDEGGRQHFVEAIDGQLTQKVWDADKPLQYGVVKGSYAVSGQSYDEFGRGTVSVSGTTQAFDLSKCAPNAADRSNSSCMPTSQSANPALQQHSRTYDQSAGTGNGLKALWYDNDQFGGVPVSTTVINQDPDNGIAVQPPAGVGNKSAWGLRLSGGLVLPEKGTYNLVLEVPQSMFSAATVYVGSSICTVVPAGQTQASCTIESDGATYPMSVYLAHAANAASTGNISVSVQTGRQPSSMSNQNFIPTWSAVTTNASTDHTSTGEPIIATETYAYGNPITPAATTTTDLPLVRNGTATGSGSLSWTSVYEPTQFGGSQAVKVTNPGGNSGTSSYWGMTDTPASLPNASQIPAAYQQVPQHGLLKMQQQPGGRQQWYVYDQYGNLVCQADVMAGNAPAWACIEMNDRGLLTTTTSRGQDGQDELRTTYSYLYDSDSDHAPFVLQRTTTVDGNVLTDESRQWIDGTVDQYIGVDGSATKTAYRSDGKIDSVTTHVSLDGAEQVMSMGAAHSQVLHGEAPRQPDPAASASPTAAPTNPATNSTTLQVKYDYDSSDRLSTVSDANGTLATINYNSSDPRRVDSYDYLGGSVSQTIQYDAYGRAAGTSWKLPDTTIEGSVDTSASGIAASEKFGQVTQAYDYDGFGRLLRNTIANGSATNYFSYGWDSDGNRTCAAANIANPDNAACSSLPGATTFTYKKDLLTATSSPQTTVPAGSMLKDGAFGVVGDQAYQYDANRQLVDVSVTSVKPAPPAPAPSPTSAAPAPTDPTSAAPAPSSAPASPSAGDSTMPTPSDKSASATAVGRGQSDTDGKPVARATDATATPTRQSASPKPHSPSASKTQSASPSPSASSDPVVTPTPTPTPTETGTPSSSPTPTPSPSPPADDPTAAISFFRDAANRPLATTTTKASGTKAGYTSVYTAMNGGLTATVSGNQVTRQLGLPGGLTLQGDTPVIHSIGSTAAVVLNSDGSQGQNQIQVWGPYGEPVAAAPQQPVTRSATAPSAGWHGTSGMLDDSLITLGARSYRTDLGMFLQVDPIVSGSSTMNDHAYVAGDPVNTSDLTGTSIWNDSERDALVNIAGCLIEMPILELSYKLVDRLPEGFWMGAKGLGAKMLTFFVNAGVNYGISMGLAYALSGGKEGMDTVTAHIAMVTAIISGYCASMGTANAYRGMGAFKRMAQSASEGALALAKRIGKAVGAGMKEYADARAGGATAAEAMAGGGTATLSAAVADNLVADQAVVDTLAQGNQLAARGVQSLTSTIGTVVEVGSNYGATMARTGAQWARDLPGSVGGAVGGAAWRGVTYLPRTAWSWTTSATRSTANYFTSGVVPIDGW